MVTNKSSGAALSTLADLPQLTDRFPFRLGTTSYIVPADLKTNIKALAGKIDDIEILLFESDEISDLPNAETIDFLDTTAARTNLTYTIHLPLECRLGHSEKAERQRAVDQCLRIMSIVRPLDPFAFILHLNGDRHDPVPVDNIPVWQKHLAESLELLLLGGFTPSELCIENLSYPFEMVMPIVDEFGLSICLDIGHILMGNYPLSDYLDLYLDRARVVHFHGILNGRDHKSIAHLPRDVVDLVYSRLSNQAAHERVVTLEIFSADDLATSLKTMEEQLR